VSTRCGCAARFSIFHHISSNSLRVEWYWKQNHDPNSHDDMLVTQAPEVVNNWLRDHVDSGLQWKSIHNLIRTPYIVSVSFSVHLDIPRATRRLLIKLLLLTIRLPLRKSYLRVCARCRNSSANFDKLTCKLLQRGTPKSLNL
jgi:hypothetical protein